MDSPRWAAESSERRGDADDLEWLDRSADLQTNASMRPETEPDAAHSTQEADGHIRMYTSVCLLMSVPMLALFFHSAQETAAIRPFFFLLSPLCRAQSFAMPPKSKSKSKSKAKSKPKAKSKAEPESSSMTLAPRQRGRKRTLSDREADSEEPLHLDLDLSHSGSVFVWGMGDMSQLGLGEDIVEKMRPYPLSISSHKVGGGGKQNKRTNGWMDGCDAMSNSLLCVQPKCKLF